jgi:predicted nucleotidyltransferase
VCSQSTLNKITSAVAGAARDSLGSRLDKVILYGSYARGDYDDESDIDIMILADIPHEDTGKERKRIWALVGGLDLEHGVVVSVHVLDCVTFYKFADDLPFYRNVMRDGVLLVA